MKKFYILAMAAVLSAGFANADSQSIKAKRDGVRIPSLTAKLSAKEEIRRGPKFAAPGTVSKPGKIVEYEYIKEDENATGTWQEGVSLTYTYDNEGRRLSQQVNDANQGNAYRETYTYNDKGQVAEMIGASPVNGGFQESWKNIYTYDNVVVDFVTCTTSYSLTDNKWVQYEISCNNIERNNQGNIVNVTSKLNNTYLNKIEWSYDDSTDKATTCGYYESETGNDDWTLVDGCLYTDIEWDRTNGQLVGDELDDFLHGQNRFKKVKLVENGKFTGYYTAEYIDDNLPVAYRLTRTSTNPEEILSVATYYYDENGAGLDEYLDYVDENGITHKEPADGVRFVTTCDEHGNQDSEIEYSLTNGEWEINYGSSIENIYYADGNLQQATYYSYNRETGKYDPTYRRVFSDYKEFTGISEVASDSAAWNISNDAVSAQGSGVKGLSLYNLQGVRLMTAGADANLSTSSLQPGIYLIHAEGTSATIRYIKR